MHAHPLASQSKDAAAAMRGISNEGRTPGQPYVTAGDRAYLIGTQDGGFPDIGQHTPGEMGGLWLQPIKLADGFWATVRDSTSGREVALSEADELVTYPYGTRLRYGPVLDGLEVDRFQFSPDGQAGVVLQYRLRNTTGQAKQIELLFSTRTELSPVWYSDRIGIRDAPDTVVWRASDRTFLARDTGHDWFVVWGAIDSKDAEPAVTSSTIPTSGMGVTATSRHRLSVGPRGTSAVTFVFAGSPTGEAEALRTYRHLARNQAPLLERKKQRSAALLERARISIPDRRLQEVYDWVRVNMDWLVREVPGIGRGLSGGLMEYPWWFGTETYSLQALMATGDFELPKQTLRLLRRHSDRTNRNGRIIHEVTGAGVIVNPGNSQETAQFILTVGKLIEWSGDLELARRCTRQCGGASTGCSPRWTRTGTCSREATGSWRCTG
jgi:hypothetical protein